MDSAIHVAVCDRPLQPADELERLYRLGGGALASFTGQVRDENGTVDTLALEHYPPLTLPGMHRAAADAKARWSLLGVSLLHRVGALKPGELVVFVGTVAAHRQQAQEACECLVDWLKTGAAFWKREHKGDQWKWLEPTATDLQRASRWRNQYN